MQNRQFQGLCEPIWAGIFHDKWTFFVHPVFTMVLSIVMRKLNSVTYEVGKAKAEQASGMFGLTAE